MPGRPTGIVPVYLWNHLLSADNRDGLFAPSERPVLPEAIEGRRTKFRRLRNQESYFLERILSGSRVLIVEGISGSGKDMFQQHLKNKLQGRDVHDYSEGEVLQSWNQLQIDGIFKLRVKFMKLFVNYVKKIVTRDENAVFLLNRFHLSAYAMTIVQQPKLEKEYDEIINVLRTLPVHVFILRLDENEIEKRTLHPERSSAWQKFQQQIVQKEGFRDKLERYISQQRQMLEAAEKQQIPYSVIKVSSAPTIGSGWIRTREAPSIFPHGVRLNAADAAISRKKRRVPQTVEEDN